MFSWKKDLINLRPTAEAGAVVDKTLGCGDCDILLSRALKGPLSRASSGERSPFSALLLQSLGIYWDRTAVSLGADF